MAVETRNVIELLRMAVAQQAAYSYSSDHVHSTPRQSRSYSQCIELPTVSSSERRRRPLQDNPPQNNNLLVNAQAIMDQARARREAEAAAAAHVVAA